jgi:alanine racemase
VLCDLAQLERWRRTAERRGPLPAAVHFDTGLNRLGMPASEQAILLETPELVRPFRSVLWMSHLACAEEPAHPMNGVQLTRFRALLLKLPKGHASFVNSSGIFLGAETHFDVARPGYALYGGNPTPWRPSRMRQVVHLTAEILQVRDVDTPGTVGYGAAHRVAGPTRVATIPVGYADGYLRSLSGRGHALIDGHTVPVIGRVSMDLTTLDVSAVPPKVAYPGARVTLIGGRMTVDDVAARAGTIGYEILVALGDRYARRYVEGVGGR